MRTRGDRQGGGTPARLLAEVYDPPPRLEAWELDPRVLDACRLGMGLEEIERAARVRVRAGNPLGATPAPAPAGGAPAEGADGGAPEGAGGAAGEGGAEAGSSRPPAAPGGKFAGVIVDLFIDGKLLPQLMSEDAWRAIRSRLADPETGRVMAHVGPASDGEGRLVPATVVALNAMARAFDGARPRASAAGEYGGLPGGKGGSAGGVARAPPLLHPLVRHRFVCSVVSDTPLNYTSNTYIHTPHNAYNTHTHTHQASCTTSTRPRAASWT